MIGTIEIAGKRVPRLGLGAWAISGPFFLGKEPMGWGEVDESVSKAAIHTALDMGIRLFDTADVYGASNGERLLGEALEGREDVVIATKFGVMFDPKTRQVTGTSTEPDYIRSAIDASRKRLKRDCLDLVFLHLNQVEPGQGKQAFDTLDELVAGGKITSYGWSTDYLDNAAYTSGRRHSVAIQHAMNVFFPASKVRAVAGNMLCFNRSPLAMGFLSDDLLAGRKKISDTDIRSKAPEWLSYFEDGKPVPEFLDRLQSVADIIRKGRKTLVEGALAYNLGKSKKTVPIPGFRTPAQVADLLAVLDSGPMSADDIASIEALLPPEDPEIRDR